MLFRTKIWKILIAFLFSCEVVFPLNWCVSMCVLACFCLLAYFSMDNETLQGFRRVTALFTQLNRCLVSEKSVYLANLSVLVSRRCTFCYCTLEDRFQFPWDSRVPVDESSNRTIETIDFSREISTMKEANSIKLGRNREGEIKMATGTSDENKSSKDCPKFRCGRAYKAFRSINMRICIHF